ncbi:MAG: protein-L-isoaspartate O-methyltransferase [Sulfuricurvum sp. PC08-66]|nr:MAG: protein-L-isoaspartate O-methyltransferase [Sulfuricurvum sp. PC08-66]
MDKLTATKNLRLAQEIAKQVDIDERIIGAFASINRELFVPNGFKNSAYKLDALPIGAKQWISSPVTVAKMTQYLFLRNADSVLEIGCGSGYQAAILSKLVRRVCTIERIEPLLREATERFRTLGLHNIFAKAGDGQEGWSRYAPYDRILFSAAPSHIPQALIDQLVEGGIIIAPLQQGNAQIITRMVKEGNRLISTPIEACEFVPVVDGVER